MRPVTADHILFNECITYFRQDKSLLNYYKDTPAINAEIFGYLLFDFNFINELEIDNFKILRSVKVSLGGAYRSFVSPVILPSWLKGAPHFGHLFTNGLASLISFAINRPVKSTRDGYNFIGKLKEEDYREIGLQFPVLVCGPGCHDSELSKETFEKYCSAIKDIYNILFALSKEEFFDAMQAVRLVQLAHLNKREDFALGYSLLIASIESMAQKAIKRRAVKKGSADEERWKKLSETDENFKKLYNAYKTERGGNKYIKERFLEFILKYCPIKEWNSLEHPEKNFVLKLIEDGGGDKYNWLLKKHWDESAPEDLPEEYIKIILKEAYNHRSNFVHRGENPPHKNPEPHDIFFEKNFVFNKNKIGYNFLLPFRLMAHIANISIVNYLKINKL